MFTGGHVRGKDPRGVELAHQGVEVGRVRGKGVTFRRPARGDRQGLVLEARELHLRASGQHGVVPIWGLDGNPRRRPRHPLLGEGDARDGLGHGKVVRVGPAGDAHGLARVALQDHALHVGVGVLLHRRRHQHVRALLLQRAVHQRGQVVQGDARDLTGVPEPVVVGGLGLARRHLVDPLLGDVHGQGAVPHRDLHLLLAARPLPVRRNLVAADEMGPLVLDRHLAAREGDVGQQPLLDLVPDALVGALILDVAVGANDEGLRPRVRPAKQVFTRHLGVQRVEDRLLVLVDLPRDIGNLFPRQGSIARPDHETPDRPCSLQDLVQCLLRVLEHRRGVVVGLPVDLVVLQRGLQVQGARYYRRVVGQPGIPAHRRELTLQVQDPPRVLVKRVDKGSVHHGSGDATVHLRLPPHGGEKRNPLPFILKFGEGAPPPIFLPSIFPPAPNGRRRTVGYGHWVQGLCPWRPTGDAGLLAAVNRSRGSTPG